MQRLPYELLDLICSLLNMRDIWALTQVSTYFRLSAIFPLLSRFGISPSDVHSGVISLSHSFFLIPFISRIQPIRRLVCFGGDDSRRCGHEDLIAVLSEAEPIPDILIHDRYGLSKTPQRAANLLSRLPQTKDSTLLLIKHGSISVSRPRTGVASLQRKSMPPRLVSMLSVLHHKIIRVAGLYLLTYLASCILNLRVLLAWAYQRFGPALDQRSRIEDDIRPLYPGHWMRIDATLRIQTVAADGGDFALVTIAGELSRLMGIPRIPGLDEDVYGAMLASLELSEHLVHLTIEKDCNLAQADVVEFIQRHPNLETISFEPGSIRASTNLKGIPQIHSSKIRTLSAPAAYIPGVIWAAQNVERISILVTCLEDLEKTATLREYHLALASVASLPGAKPIVLSLVFHLTASGLPWIQLPAAEAKGMEASLIRVEEIILGAQRPLRFDGAAMRWLGLFPSLKRVAFMKRCLVPMSKDERHLLVAAIREVRKDSSLSIVFDVR
ncbi:hypothetical protein DFH07DRAFT_110690 [Mycena maculata]|uniref:F-box domain-containing protein n=1 Tax=Mycena maculata TaxID=230809 RepID=A0AAD7I5I7_9AGAR|nr:hypothetical protein DFH07DRAFT_110690 [Mycena maculata]